MQFVGCAVCAVVQFVQWCSLCNGAVCAIVRNCAVCAIVQVVQLCSLWVVQFHIGNLSVPQNFLGKKA